MSACTERWIATGTAKLKLSPKFCDGVFVYWLTSQKFFSIGQRVGRCKRIKRELKKFNNILHSSNKNSTVSNSTGYWNTKYWISLRGDRNIEICSKCLHFDFFYCIRSANKSFKCLSVASFQKYSTLPENYSGFLYIGPPPELMYSLKYLMRNFVFRVNNYYEWSKTQGRTRALCYDRKSILPIHSSFY